MSVENDVKEDLEQARLKQELEKLTQEKEQEIIKEKRKYINIFLGIIKEERKYIYIIIINYFIHALSYFK